MPLDTNSFDYVVRWLAHRIGSDLRDCSQPTDRLPSYLSTLDSLRLHRFCLHILEDEVRYFGNSNETVERASSWMRLLHRDEARIIALERNERHIVLCCCVIVGCVLSMLLALAISVLYTYPNQPALLGLLCLVAISAGWKLRLLRRDRSTMKSGMPYKLLCWLKYASRRTNAPID